AGWTLRSRGDARILEGPEPGVRVGLVDVKAPSADAAVAAAWPALHPDFKRPLKLSQASPGRHGWEEERFYLYETSPNEKLLVFADAQRKGQSWTIMLLEASEAPFQRRASQVRLVGQSLRPQGYARESFKGKTAHVLDGERIKQITDFVDRSREPLGIPGVAITLVQDGKV